MILLNTFPSMLLTLTVLAWFQFQFSFAFNADSSLHKKYNPLSESSINIPSGTTTSLFLKSSLKKIFKKPFSLKNRIRRRYKVKDGEQYTEEDFKLLSENEVSISMTSPMNNVSSFSILKNFTVSSLNELHNLILEGVKLEDIELNYSSTSLSNSSSSILDHEVLKLIKYRAETKSKPGRRCESDTAKLALAIEGGGMRGAVSAGMAAAIASLGLLDTIDEIYGSSAGAIIGAYMVSRQACVDVYTELLPAAKSTFVSKFRMFSSLFSTYISDIFTSSLLGSPPAGMNISFVLDGIMSREGLRPLDLDAFHLNDKVQPLKVVSSVVVDDKLETLCFNSKEGDFSDDETYSLGSETSSPRRGLFACLEASMNVPGATGPPVKIKRAKRNDFIDCVDAFCYEPIPYRSPVDAGATHVLALRTRPDGCEIKTKPGIYEKTIAPLYFRTNNQPKVEDYFKQGGQQFRYLEDVMALDEGCYNGSEDGVTVPPVNILYGNIDSKAKWKNRKKWKKAHLLPVVVSKDKPELSALDNSQHQVLQAVRTGFATAFDLLAPTVVDIDDTLNGERVAELLFPPITIDNVLEKPLQVTGDFIHKVNHNPKRPDWVESSSNQYDYLQQSLNSTLTKDASVLLSYLPGLQSGKLAHLAKDLFEVTK